MDDRGGVVVPASAPLATRAERDAAVQRLDAASSMDELFDAVDSLRMLPGWHPNRPPVPRQPTLNFKPYHWDWDVAKAALEAAGRLVDTKQAERRNLVLLNPAGRYPTTPTLVAAYQTLLPGEVARSHRHTPNAGRLMLDVGEGVWTIVDGVQIDLEVGDVVLTPGWCWHGHGNDGSKYSTWLDFVDTPLVYFLDTFFFEPYPGEYQDATERTRTGPYVFPWKETKKQLENAATDEVFGTRVQLGDPAFPSMALYMERIRAGERIAPYRTTASRQYCVVEGKGRSKIEGLSVEWSRGDVFVAPCWSWQEHVAEEDSVLFVMTDEPLQRYLRFFRTEVGADAAQRRGEIPAATVIT